MGVCDGRELTQAEREAGYQQQRTGVVQALRPFSGPATVDNLVDYINRELGPAVRNSRNKVNDVFRQVADNAPSANPLAYYFSTNTANADPTTGRVRLNASPQNTATILRISEENGRLQNVTPWLDVMAGGATTPIGVVTLLDAVNPGRSLRFDLHTMVDQGAYWDLGVTLVESSHPDPFVDGGGVVLSFIAGCASTGATVPVGSLSPVANDTFLGNVSGASAAPSAVALSTLAGAGLAFGTHTLDVTGSTSIVITSDQVQRAALTGDVTAAQNSNATTIAAHAITNAQAAQMAADTFKGNNTNATADPADVALSAIGSTSLPYDATSHTFRRAALTGEVTASINSNATTVTRSTDFASTPWTGSHQFNGATLATLSSCATTLNGNVGVNAATFTTISSCASTFNGAVTCVNVVSLNRQVAFNGVISVSIGSSQNNWSPTGLAGANVIRVTATAVSLHVTGIVAQPDGTRLMLINVGTNPWTVDASSGSSTAANQVLASVASFTLQAGDILEIWYDGTSSRWRMINGIGS